MANAVDASELAESLNTAINKEISQVTPEDNHLGTVENGVMETGNLKGDIGDDGEKVKEIIANDRENDNANKEMENISTETPENIDRKEIDSETVDKKEEVDREIVNKNSNYNSNEEEAENIEIKVEMVTEEDQENKVLEEEGIQENSTKYENEIGDDLKEKIVKDSEIKEEKFFKKVSETSENEEREIIEEIDGEMDGELDEEEEEEVEEDDGKEEGENAEEKVEKPLDDDQDRRNPQYIPKGGAFYEHDNRTSLEDVENKDPQESDKKKKSWKETKESERWLHDCYNESEQLPKSTAEIINAYGYDIRNEDAPPRARRRRKYGRGPDKYDRSWEDEQAYMVKQNNIGRRGKKKSFGKEEFPPLPNQKSNSSESKIVQKTSPRRKEGEGSDKHRNVKMNGSDRSPTSSYPNRTAHSGNHSNLPGFHSNKKNFNHVNKKINDDDVKPFRNDGNKWKNNNFKQGKQDDFPIRTQFIRQTNPSFRRSTEVNRSSIKESDVSNITDGINQMTFHNKMSIMRDTRPKTSSGPEENKIHEPEMDSPANRQNPKRYSKIRKGFTGIFPPEEVPELGQSEIHKIQQEQQKNQHMNLTQPLNMQNVMKRYAGTYDFVPGNTSYLGARPIISGLPQQAMSPQGIHQQTLSPQGIPQQAMSPQVTGLQTIEIQQTSIAQPNFVPQPMYIDMDAHYPSDVMSPYSGYSPYSGSQAPDVYQRARGITYYSPECQSSGQKLPPPPPRQKTAIPIIRPGKH